MSAATYPPDTALAAETDLFIRDLAFRTDARLSSAVKYAVCPMTTVTANAGGDITVPFPSLATIGGALVGVVGKALGQSQWPAPGGGWTNSYLFPVTLVPWTYQNGVGVGARVMIGIGYHGSAANGDQGVKPVPGGTKVPVAGIAWGPL